MPKLGQLELARIEGETKRRKKKLNIKKGNSNNTLLD